MYIIIAIIIFGVLIAVHELGHFLAAKASGVKVSEFAIGMGPAILKRQKGETLYAWRALPIGGYCAMDEDSESNDPRAFINQKTWKKAIILFAGAAMNFLLGFIVILIISGSLNLKAPTITNFFEGCPYQGESGLLAGDTFYKIDGERIYFDMEVRPALRGGDDIKDIVVIRDGKKVHLTDYNMPLVEYPAESGGTELMHGIHIGVAETGAAARLKNSWNYSLFSVKQVWLGLRALVSGAVSLREMSGVVGIVDVINDVGQQSETPVLAATNIANITAFITINLAVMNLLPIPALDGGRIFFLAVTWIVERVTRRKVNPKYEGYIHAAGLVLLLGLMAVIMVSDVINIFTA